MNIMDLLNEMENYWSNLGCIKILPYDYPIGAATYHPFCFFKSLTNSPIKLIYAQPSRRKADGRYAQSPNRLFSHHQFQVLLRPIPNNIKELILKNLEHIGFDLSSTDIKFIPNDWKSASIGATGVGYEIWINGMEICQYTYFQKIANKKITPVLELAYGVERLLLNLEQKKSFFQLDWHKYCNYSSLFKNREEQFSKFFLQYNYLECNFKEIVDFSYSLLKEALYYPAYEELLRLNNLFNSFDALRQIDEEKRKIYVDEMKKLAEEIANCFLKNGALV